MVFLFLGTHPYVDVLYGSMMLLYSRFVAATCGVRSG